MPPTSTFARSRPLPGASRSSCAMFVRWASRRSTCGTPISTGPGRPMRISPPRELLAKYNLPVLSLAGGFGATPQEFEAACRLAAALGAGILAGSTPLLAKDRAVVVAILKQYDVKLGIENHP